MAEFSGWPRAALTFLKDLEANNDRDWFKANRARYDEHLVAPAQALATDLKKLGEPKLFRPFHDTRFHKGPPIKEHVSFLLGSMSAGGYYVELSRDGLFLGAGIHHPASDQVERWRAAVADGRKGAALTRALDKATAAGMALGEPALQRVPRGFAPDHPRAEHLRRRSFTVSRREKPGRWLHTPECSERIRDALAACSPLVRWLGEHVGPSQRPA